MLGRPQQLPLALCLSDDNTFDNFYVGDNDAAFAYVKKLCDAEKSWLNNVTYLWGTHSVGCTHLLQAACLQFELTGCSAIYLPMADLIDFTPDLLENLEQYDLVCLDDVDILKGHKEWQEAIFHLFNRLYDSEKCLLIAAKTAPNGLDIELSDLRSRLTLALVFQIHPLSDEDKVAALKMRATQRGFALTDELARYVLTHGKRDMVNLINLLNQLDKASLQAKHKLTIPFVKQVLGW